MHSYEHVYMWAAAHCTSWFRLSIYIARLRYVRPQIESVSASTVSIES